jgi:L-lactate dehydrogenase complex protein LldE
MVDEKLRAIRSTGANWLVYADAGCALNITGYANRIKQPLRAMHIAELIDKSLGDHP